MATKGDLEIAYDRQLLPKGALIEYEAKGNFVKVSAVDPITFLEVSLVGDIHVGRYALGLEAVRKLERMIKIKKQSASKTNYTPSTKPGWYA